MSAGKVFATGGQDSPAAAVTPGGLNPVSAGKVFATIAAAAFVAAVGIVSIP